MSSQFRLGMDVVLGKLFASNIGISDQVVVLHLNQSKKNMKCC